MSEMAPEKPARTPEKVARDLTEIDALFGQLPGQAINDGDDPAMPGGRAMVALGPVANMEAWEAMNQASERYGRNYTWDDLEDPEDAWPAFQIVNYWAAAWRRERGWETEKRPTMLTETAFVRYSLEWAWDHEPAWTAMSLDINRARVKLEDVLFAGSRVEKSRVVCANCPGNIRLIVIRGSEPEDDRWKCKGCGGRFDQDDVARAHAKMMRTDEKAQKWVPQRDAIDILKSQGNRESTIRKWLAEGEGEGYCDPVNHEVWCWWPSLWRRHLMEQAKKATA